MSVRMRHTRSHTRNRRSHHGIDGPVLTVNKETKIPNVRHRVSLETGTYRGRQVIDVTKKQEKKEAKKKARESK